MRPKTKPGAAIDAADHPSIVARRCALYSRVSTKDQNPALARAELRQGAAARGMEVFLDIEETGSGRKNDRPGLQRIMEAARRGQVSAVLCWKIDRFGRSTLDLLANIQALNRAGVRFIATSQGIDVGPEGGALANLTLTVLSAVAEFERELVSERTVLAYRAVKARGGAWGRPRVKAPSGAAVIAERREGKSWAEISAKLGCTAATARRRAAEAA